MVLSKDGSPDIYVQDLISNQLIRVTDHPAIDTEPSWTPDGQFIVFMSDRTGQPQIYQIALGANSYDVERLTYDCFQCAKARFLPDGVNLVHVRRETRQALYKIAIFTSSFIGLISLIVSKHIFSKISSNESTSTICLSLYTLSPMTVFFFVGYTEALFALESLVFITALLNILSSHHYNLQNTNKD